MKALRVAFAVVVLLLPMLNGTALGQAAPTEPVLASEMATAQQQYAAAFVAHPQLYSGPEYIDYTLRYHERDGHQFFLVPEKQPGSVDYNDHLFANLRLAYDVVLDQVVLSPPNSPLMLRLLSERVRSFIVNDHRFIRLVADSSGGNIIHTGFYEVLADGPVQVLAKRAKRLQQHIVQPYVNVQFTGIDKVFIKRANTYYLIKGKGAAMHLFSDRSKEMQRFLKEQKLSFKGDSFEPSIVRLATYYANLPAR